MSNTSKKTVQMTQLALLIALLTVLGLTPLGFIQIPPIAITLMHIPVIIGAIVLGPTYGSILGLAFGILSMVRATMTGVSPADLAFSPFASGVPIQSILMSVVPRVLLGLIAGFLYQWLSDKIKNRSVVIGISAGVATLVHTVLVLGFMAVFFADLGVTFQAIILTVLSLNGLLELIAGIIISIGVCIPLMKYNQSKAIA